MPKKRKAKKQKLTARKGSSSSADNSGSVVPDGVPDPTATGNSAASATMPWRWGVLALLPLLLSVAFAWAGPRPQPAPISPKPVQFAFEEYLIDYGPQPVPPRPFIGGRFRFRNPTNVPLQITELEASCGCMQPVLTRNGQRLEPNSGDRQIWQPGDYGEVLVRVRTANQSAGPHEYIMKLNTRKAETEDTASATDLAFKVVLPQQKVVIEPKALMFYQLSDQSIQKDVIITDMRGGDLKIDRVQTSFAGLSAEVTGATINAQGMRELTVRVTVSADVPPGRTRGLVNLMTNDETYPVLQVPVIVQGRSATTVAQTLVEPALLVLEPGAAEDILQGEVVLKSANDQSVKRVTVEPPVVQASFTTEKDDSGKAITRVSANAKKENVTGFNRALMTIEIEGGGNVEVPVMLKK